MEHSGRSQNTYWSHVDLNKTPRIPVLATRNLGDALAEECIICGRLRRKIKSEADGVMAIGLTLLFAYMPVPVAACMHHELPQIY